MPTIHFYMLEQDDAEFAEYVISRPDTALIHGTFFGTNLPAESESTLPFSTGNREADDAEIFNTSIRSPVSCSSRGAGEFRGKWCFASYEDPSIAWRRCYFRDGALVAGFLDACALDSEADNTSYMRSYNSIARWLRKRFTRIDAGYHWYGPAALAYREAGGAVQLFV